MNRFALVLLVLLAGLFSFSASAQNPAKAEISDSIDVLHYAIHLDMVHLGTKRIAGYTDLQITPRVNGLADFPLWLQSLSVDSVKINAANAATIAYDGTLIRIGLPFTASPADTFSARVYYHGNPVTDPSSWGGFYFSSDSNYAFNLGVGFQSVPHNYGRVWFPCIDDFVDRATYDCYITTKSEKKAVCAGTLTDSTDHGNGTTTWHWTLHNSVPTYLASVAVGPYIAIKDTFHGMNGDVPSFLYISPGDSLQAPASFIHLNDILSIYEDCFGPYPWERVGYVGVPFSNGAMEHVTNIAYPLACIDGSLDCEDLYAHELSHMWFGNKTTCATAEDMWINEGWASYCEAVYKEGLYGKAAYQTHLRNLHKNVVQFTHVEDAGYRALYGIPPEYTYASTVYDKGADVVHTLRGYLGDSLFFGTVKSMLNDYAYQHISSAGMRDYFTLHTGIDMTGFWNAWVFAPGFPHFAIDSFRVTGGGPAQATVYFRQRLDNAPAFADHNILEVRFMDEQWHQYNDTVHFSGEHGVKTFNLPFVPSLVMMDPDDKISDALTSFTRVVKTSGTQDMTTTWCVLDVQSVSDSALVRVEHNYVAPDPLKSANPDIKRLSPYRFWKVDGLFPAGFHAKAKFRYNKTTGTSTGYLDNTLMTSANSKDSLLLLYRRDPSDDWRIVPFVIAGTSTGGDLIADTLRPGEYTLAVGLPYISGLSLLPAATPGGISVWPNPSADSFRLQWNGSAACRLSVFNPYGALVDDQEIDGKSGQATWTPGNLSEGMYVLQILDKQNRVIASGKVVYKP